MSSESGSSFGDSSSDVSSQFSDEHSGSLGRRRRVFKKSHNSTINVVNNSGQVVVGEKRATIKSVPLNHPTGEESLEQPSTSVIPPPENSSSKEVNSENGRGILEETIIEVGENGPGSYYRSNREQQDVKKAQKWNAKPSKVILYSKGVAKFKWSIKEFLENPVKFICDMDNNACSIQEEKEDFILQEILPHLEGLWGRCSSSNAKIYEILARISCSRKSAKVVRQALQLLLYLTCKDNFDSCHENVLVVEVGVRSSILSPEGLFKTDRNSERELKLYAYSRILSLLVIQQVRKGELRIETLTQDLKKLRKELKQFGDKLENKKKDGFRYSIEFILEAIPCLLKPQDKLKVLLAECQEFCSNRKITSGELKILQGLKKDTKCIDLHCILIYLHGKVYCEHPVPQMETERRAMTLFRLLVETYLKRGGGDDWRFCLSAASILSDIAMNNVTKEVRREAGECLVNLLKDTKVQKLPESRASVQRRSSEVLLCHDKEIRTFLVHFLYENQSLEHDLPEDLHIKHLSSMYRTPTLEISQTVISRSSDYFVTHGMFQRQKVAVKVLFVKKQHLLEDNPSTHARERLIREADCLRRLNECRHPNITVLLGYNTKSLPYHIITTFEKFGDLLQFVRRSRENSPRPQPVQLLKMLVDIADALLHLEKLGLVHRAVMAANVLVGDYYVCKLSGMQSLQQLTNQADDPDSAYSYCSVNGGLPEFVSTKVDEELPVRWQAPESLSEHRYSTASDVWAFGMLMYEVLTYGCLPYRHIGKDDEVSFHITNGKDVQPHSEQCFEENEYELMMQCCELQQLGRPKLFEVKARLIEMHENADEEQPRPDPPSLDNQSIGDEADLYEDVEGQEQPRPDPPSLDNHVSYESSSIGDEADLYEDVEERYDNRLWHLSKGTEGMSVVREKIKKENYQHLRRLLGLDHLNLVPIWKMKNLDTHSPTVEIISKGTPLGDLKKYVLDKKCRIGDIVTFLSQVVSAVHYLHVNHIVHGDLRAEHVSVIAPDKVQIGYLGRSKPLNMGLYEVTSTSCVAEAAMPPDAIRWSAPEVILEGLYTHASDVWALGITAWELYTSFTIGEDRQELSVPFYDIETKEILAHVRNYGPLKKPNGCPDWVYVLMHQCWAYGSVQRPPALAILDCLTSRKPMETWIMTFWLKRHDKSKWPDLKICQTEDACHVTDMKSHPSKEVIKMMCPDGFFANHKYTYVDNPLVTTRHDEDDGYLGCPKAGTSEAGKSLDISSEHQAAYSSLTLVRDAEDCNYSHCTKAGTSEASESLDISSEHQAAYSSLIPVRDAEDYDCSYCSKAGTSEAIERLDISSGYHAAYSSLTLLRDNIDNYEYSCSPKAGNSEGSESLNISSEYQASYSSPISVERDNLMEMNKEPREPHDNDSASSCPLTIEAEQRSDNEKHSSNQDTGEGFECKRGHTEIYQEEAVSRTPHETSCSQKTKIKKGVVEDSNMAFSFDQDGASLLGTETGQPLIEAHNRGQETFRQLNRSPDDIACNNTARVSERNPIALAWLNDPTLEGTQQIPQPQELGEEGCEITSQDIVSEYRNVVNSSSTTHEECEADMLSPRTTFSNLKEYVHSRSCEEEDIITYLCQVASGLCYLHDNHFVHGDLRAEHVHLTEREKVQVGHLGRSRKLYMSADEDKSTSCVAKATMPPDSTRWSAPEVMLDGHYTYASDVWAFGILAWELYASFTTGHDKRDLSVPFYGLQNCEILSHLRNRVHIPLSKPESCPFWVYIIMHQCWAYDPVQRPDTRAILDCLKSRKPLKSWTMTYWANQSKRERPDSSVRRSLDACLVTATNKQPSKDDNYEANNREFGD